MARPVELYLIRHGIAEERGEAWPDDRKRPLTKKGESRLREQAAGLAALGVTVDVVLTSPLTRARQTAEIIAKGLPEKPPVEVAESLSPGAAFARFVQDLSGRQGAAKIACVGHEPDLGHLAAKLLDVARPLEFKKGAVCRIDLDDVPPAEGGTLRWFATPRMLRRSANG
jgi:phosphohistidine phosphatase